MVPSIRFAASGRFPIATTGAPVTRSAPTPRGSSVVRRVAVVLAALVAVGWLSGGVAGAVDGEESETEPSSASTTTEVSDDPSATGPDDTMGEPSDTTDTTEDSSPTTSLAPTTTAEPVVTTRPAPPTTNAPNPLVVAGPSDGRRQLSPSDRGQADIADVESPVVAPPADDAERRIRLIVTGLIIVAAVLSALAAYYWWITRPEVIDAAAEQGQDDGDHDLVKDDTVEPWLTDSTSTR